MKLDLNKILVGNYRVREKLDDEHVKEIMESFKKDGQWNPIIVVLSNERPGFYELVSGEHRYTAAKSLGWKDIEATVKDIDPVTAKFLSLKANIIGTKSMSPLEEGLAIRSYMSDYDQTQDQIAKELGRSRQWVGERLALAINISEEVQAALAAGGITLKQAVIISQIENEQNAFLAILLKEQKDKQRTLTKEETRALFHCFQNDTIYTIGYAGRDWKAFVAILKEHGIEQLVDIRDSAKSTFKPEFNEDVMTNALKDARIVYLRRQDLGVPYEVRSPYIDGCLADNCFEQWYRWSVTKRKDMNKQVNNLIPGLIKQLKGKKSVLMCEEASPVPTKTQKHRCHRDILAKLVLEYRAIDQPLLKFEKRIDL
ncbi:MAG TPA: ParB/RepB/Spo0J family partition protein [Methanothrix sp.]|nr:ParB/RepB/Spo0J family partition protein [Methanothrix sp.]